MNEQVVDPAADAQLIAGVDSLVDVADWTRADVINFLIYVGAAVALYVVLVGVRLLVRRLLGRADSIEPHSWRHILSRTLRRTRSFFLFAIAARLVTFLVEAEPGWVTAIHFLFTVAAVIQVAMWLREFVLAVIERRSAHSGQDSAQLSSAMGVIRVITNVAIWAVAAIVILDNLGVNVTALVAGLGIGGIAIGLAAQGIFSDLFAALSILFDKPFVKGDVITVDTLTGTVEAIGLKTTRIRAISGELVSISNAKLLENRIHNLAELQRRRVVMTIGVIYQTPPDVLARLPDEIRSLIEAVENTEFDRAFLSNFGASSIDIEIIFFVNSMAMEDMLHARHHVILALLRRFDELGVDFAYPTQTTFTAAPDGTMIMPYAERQPS